MELHYKKYGLGFPLVVVHGLYGSSDNWVGIARELAKNYEVYCLDMRNHGQSPHAIEHTYEAMAGDLYDFVEQQNFNRAIFLGHSMGGKVCMFFANRYPQKVSKLIVADIAPKKYKSMSKVQSLSHFNILTTMNKLKLSDYENRSDIEQELLKDIKSERIVKFLLKNIRLQKKQQPKFLWKLNVKSLLDQLEEILEGVDASSLKKISDNFPVLFLKGENSSYITPQDEEIIKRLYQNSTIKTIKNAGHWLHAENPEQFIGEIKRFITK